MKKCPNCNLYYDDSADVCSACNGALVDANAAPQYEAPQQYEAPSEQQYYAPQPQPAPEPQANYDYAQQPQQQAQQTQQQQQYYQPQPQPQPQYNYPPQAPASVYDNTKQPVTIGKWVGVIILSAIPIVNIICWIVWLCSSSTNKSIKNFLIAEIIVYAICIVLAVLFTIISTALGLSLLDSLTGTGYSELVMNALF